MRAIYADKDFGDHLAEPAGDHLVELGRTWPIPSFGKS